MTLIPKIYQIKSVTHETSDVFTWVLTAKESGSVETTSTPGQFNMLYHFGFGEVPISLSGDPSNRNDLVHTIRAIGSVTKSMQKLEVGDEIGVRGPFGSGWPLLKKQCDVLVIAGGIGLAPLRSLLFNISADKALYRNITLLYGARNPGDIIYRKDLERWQEEGVKVNITVDQADVDWQGQVGVVTSLIKKNIKDPENTLVYICGPEIMIKFSIHELLGAKVEKSNIFMSLERNMQCAVGFCGRCQYGPYFLCKDGPVLSYEKLQNLLMVKEL